ncbi:hypothetical protein QOT17_022421 [Balamuthia mandrillaris]
MAAEIREKNDRLRTPQVCSALFLVKQAVDEVLGSLPLLFFAYSAKTKGKVAFTFSGQVPADEVVRKIEASVNDKIKANVEIAGCAREHISPVGALGGLVIPRVNHRAPKNELEFCIELGAPKAASSQPGQSKQQQKQKQSNVDQQRLQEEQGNVEHVSAVILDDLFALLREQLQGNEAALAAIQEKEAATRKAAAMRLERRLVTLRNRAYTNGFTAHVSEKVSLV